MQGNSSRRFEPWVIDVIIIKIHTNDHFLRLIEVFDTTGKGFAKLLKDTLHEILDECNHSDGNLLATQRTNSTIRLTNVPARKL